MDEKLISNDLQKKLFQIIQTLSYKVIDCANSEIEMPYVIIGQDIEKKQKYSKDENFKLIETSIEVVTNRDGFKKAKTMQQNIFSLLNKEALSLDNFKVEELDLETYSNSNNKDFLISGIDLEILFKQIS